MHSVDQDALDSIDRCDEPETIYLEGDSLRVAAITEETAMPVLELMLSRTGRDLINRSVILEHWYTFQLFMRIPNIGREGGASFQCRLLSEGEPVADVQFVREVGSSSEEGWPVAVTIQFLFASFPAEFKERIVRSDDFESLEGFVKHVEQLPEFLFASEAFPDHTTVCYVESRDDGTH